jgi:rare lipoprotein A
MDPQDNIAASKTLPLGSTAKVTNLETGKSETVKIQDRGPFVDGRVVDVSPRVAERLEMKEQGVSPVEVKPITVPQKDGGVKLGAGAAKASPQEVRQATETTKALAPRASTGAR